MPIDYLRDYDTGHRVIRNGDFAWGDSTQQHQRSLLMAHQGEYKQSPLVGLGLRNYLDDESPDDLMREIRKQFVQDGMTVNSLQITASGVSVNAYYEE